MEKSKSKHFNTYEEATEWFNSHDMADFEDQLLVNQMPNFLIKSTQSVN